MHTPHLFHLILVQYSVHIWLPYCFSDVSCVNERQQLYFSGLYEVALDTAIELQDKVEQVMGKDNAIYASCLNNIALMNKMVS